MSEAHICNLEVCKGKTFAELYVRCNKCNNPNFFDCMKSNAGVISIMKSFGVIDANGKVKMSVNDAHSVHLQIKAIFSKDSIFKFTCDGCIQKESNFQKQLIDDLRKCQTDLTNAQNASKKLAKQNRILEYEHRNIIDENLKLHLEVTQLEDKLQDDFVEASDKIHQVGVSNKPQKQEVLTSKSSNQPKSSASTDDMVGGSYEIFVSKFPTSTECDTISALISDKGGLQTDNFSVTKMMNPKVNKKYCKFMSFKITASDKASYDIIISDNIWAPFTKAVPFNANARSEALQRRSQNRKQKQHVPHEQPKQQISTKVNSQPKNHQNPQNQQKSHNEQPHPTKKPNKTPKPPHQPWSSHQEQTHNHYDPEVRRHNGNPRSNNNGNVGFNYDKSGRNGYRNNRVNNNNNHSSNFRGKKWTNHKPQRNSMNAIIHLLMNILNKH